MIGLIGLLCLTGCRPALDPGDAGADAGSEEFPDAGPDGGESGPDPGADLEIPGDGDPGDGDVDSGDSGKPVQLTVVTLNTHSFQEGFDSLEKLEWIGQGLAALEADLVGLNEVMSGTFWSHDHNGEEYDGAAIIREALESATGVAWHSAGCGFAHWDTGELMSNLILSRTPISESDCRSLTTTDFWPAPAEQRNAAYARTVIPGLGPVNFYSTHTWGWDSADTLVQISEIKVFMLEKYRGDEALGLLTGDLNVVPGSEGHRYWLEATPFRLYDTYALANPEGLHDSTVFDGESRIDFILAAEGEEWIPDPGHCVSRLVFTGEELPRVSDHRGVVTTFEFP